MSSAPPRPITPRQALLLLVARQIISSDRVDPLMAHYCLNLIVFEARMEFPGLLSTLSLPQPKKIGNDNISLQEWDTVIREKFEERLMSDDPMEYALTAEGSVIARLIEEGKVSDTAWFEPGVAQLFAGKARRFFIDKARHYATRERRELRDNALLVA